MLQKNYYQVLGLSNYAAFAEVKRAYKRMAFQCHPDRNPDNPEAEELFKQINEAYQVLSIPEAKAKYDLLLQNGHQFRWSKPHQSTYTPPSRPQRRASRRPPPREDISNNVATFVAILFVTIIYLFVQLFYDLTSRYQYLVAMDAYARQDFKAALHAAHLASTADPSFAKAVFLKGKITLEYLDNPKEATSILEEAIRIAEWPQVDYFNTCANAYLKDKNLNFAKKYLLEALEITDNKADQIKYMTPIFLEQFKEYSTVLELTQQWLESDEQAAEAYLFRALAKSHTATPAEAQKELAPLIQFSKEYDQYLARLADYYHQHHQDFQTARYFYHYLNKNYPPHARYLAQEAQLLSLLEDREGALQAYTSALELDTQNPELYYQRALILLDLGQSAAACQDWMTAKAAGFVGKNVTLTFFCEQ
ncbi:MAG: DnaJ domain-containing protein [Bernardetiaceae bacterium]